MTGAGHVSRDDRWTALACIYCGERLRYGYDNALIDSKGRAECPGLGPIHTFPTAPLFEHGRTQLPGTAGFRLLIGTAARGTRWEARVDLREHYAGVSIPRLRKPRSPSKIRASFADSYSHARNRCGCTRRESLWRAVYWEATGLWPW